MRSCIVCKREYFPGSGINFYSFPKENTANRKKWLLAIGRQSVSKTATLCSAHFPASSIHDGSGYTLKKRLKDGAVPTLNLQTLDFNHVIDGDSTLGRAATQGTEIKTEHKDTENPTQDAVEYPSERLLASHINDDIDSSSSLDRIATKGTQTTTEDYENEKSFHSLTNHQRGTKRELHTGYTEGSINDLIPYTKKLRFTIENKKEVIGPNEIFFKSQNSHQRFQNYLAFKKKQVEALRKRVKRRDSEIGSLKEVIESLRNEETSAAAEYLQGLPPHVKELIIRMKEKNKTSAFPRHLKNFARTLHFYSPAAYEVVRESFLKCLPHEKTMNKWDLSTDYEPGICGKLVDKVSEMVSLAMKDIQDETVEVKKK